MRFVLALVLTLALPATAQDLAQDTRAKIDQSVTSILAKTGAPSASIAVVKDGKLAYERAYGIANLAEKRPATPAMRYSIGSISKQFTAAAVLLLAEEGKLALDDKVVRWFPELTRASEVTIRHLLSMTSGYQDFWPQDYVMPMMLGDATPQQILDGWAKKPLDFDPGTKWQYSNTNYVIAALIVEKVSGMPFHEFLEKRIFEPLKMTSVANSDQAALPPTDPMRYHRYALGPVRVAPKEGKGWMFGAGGLAMTAADLARWNLSLMKRSLLQPQSYRELERDMQLVAGTSTGYGLGVGVSNAQGRRGVSHGGEVSGFTARNEIYPDLQASISVLVNLDATDTSGQIATAIANALFATADPAMQATLDRVKAIFAGLQKGRVDRSLFTENANFYFSDDALKDFASSLGPLGAAQEVTQVSQSSRGGMTLRRYRVKLPDRTLRLTTFIMPDGRIEQYTVAPE